MPLKWPGITPRCYNCCAIKRYEIMETLVRWRNGSFCFVDELRWAKQNSHGEVRLLMSYKCFCWHISQRQTTFHEAGNHDRRASGTRNSLGQYSDSPKVTKRLRRVRSRSLIKIQNGLTSTMRIDESRRLCASAYKSYPIFGRAILANYVYGKPRNLQHNVIPCRWTDSWAPSRYHFSMWTLTQNTIGEKGSGRGFSRRSRRTEQLYLDSRNYWYCFLQEVLLIPVTLGKSYQWILWKFPYQCLIFQVVCRLCSRSLSWLLRSRIGAL